MTTESTKSECRSSRRRLRVDLETQLEDLPSQLTKRSRVFMKLTTERILDKVTDHAQEMNERASVDPHRRVLGAPRLARWFANSVR